MTVAWVVGSGGLLGSALCRMLSRRDTTLFVPAERFRWESVPEQRSSGHYFFRLVSCCWTRLLLRSTHIEVRRWADCYGTLQIRDVECCW